MTTGNTDGCISFCPCPAGRAEGQSPPGGPPQGPCFLGRKGKPKPGQPLPSRRTHAHAALLAGWWGIVYVGDGRVCCSPRADSARPASVLTSRDAAPKTNFALPAKPKTKDNSWLVGGRAQCSKEWWSTLCRSAMPSRCGGGERSGLWGRGEGGGWMGTRASPLHSTTTTPTQGFDADHVLDKDPARVWKARGDSQRRNVIVLQVGP